jgi:hypothetical protein
MFVIYSAVVHYETILLKEQLTIHGHDLKILVLNYSPVLNCGTLCIFLCVYVGEFCWIVNPAKFW